VLGLIQEDRRVLTEELVASNEKIAELVHENELLKESNNEVHAHSHHWSSVQLWVECSG
jgi:hypothetical protein